MDLTCEIEFCYGHRLLNYDGKCRHLHGHTAKVVIALAESALQDGGGPRATDDVRTAIQSWVEQHLDSRMILCREDPAVPGLQDLGEPLYLLDENPTTENIARLLYNYLTSEGLPVAAVQLWESANCSATYFPGKSA